jgi:hypothetical protein
MTKPVHARPQPGEYAEFHANYVGKVPGDNILRFLKEQMDSTATLLRNLDESTAEKRYAEGKWSVKEVIGHIIDCERVFAYRALVFARGDHGPLPGFDQDTWMRHADFGNSSIEDLAAEFGAVRQSSISLLQSLPPEAWDRRGTANNKEITPRAAAFVIGGHAEHHLEILKTRYRI